MIHVVKKGDTLTQIANKYNTSVDDIMKNNTFIKNKNLINVGWKITIPEPEAVKDYEAIGKKVERLLDKIESLPEFKELTEVM